MKVRLSLLAGGMLLGGAWAAEPAADAPPRWADEDFDRFVQEVAGPPPRRLPEQFEFPQQKHWDEFVARLEQVLQDDDAAALTRFEPEARRALAGLRELPGSDEYVVWLEERIEYIEVARLANAPRPVLRPAPASPSRSIPHFDLWLQRLRGRTSPPAARRYVSRLQGIFAASGVPAELVWLAEVESSFDPEARSPVGAIGLFQFMPDTARELGLSTAAPDDRMDPEKSAQAAARRLRHLHRRFGSWPLALAAYNAGPGRVQRALDQQGADSFAEIASVLPMETRMYVPKVLATLQVRAGVSLLREMEP
jgi:membrane-bound lytic murein transglycosylase D